MIRLLILPLSVAVFFLFPAVSQATTIISPVLEIEIAPGETQNGIVKVFNETDAELLLQSSIEGFTSGGETGEPVYLSPEESGSHLNWFTLSQDSILLLPKQAALVPFTVTAPANATPGGYYAVIFWQQAADATGMVGISSKVGTLILLKVTGQLTEIGQLVEFSRQPAAEYVLGLPLQFSVRFANTGNIHLQPTGEVVLTGGGRTLHLPVNSQARVVLPESVRRFDLAVGPPTSGDTIRDFFSQVGYELTRLPFGPVQAQLTLAYGTANQQTVTARLDFWLLPWRALSVIAALLITLLIFIRVNRRVKKLKIRGTPSL